MDGSENNTPVPTNARTGTMGDPGGSPAHGWNQA